MKFFAKKPTQPDSLFAAWSYKTAWYAIKAPADYEKIDAILGIRKLRETPWREGVSATYANGAGKEIFITPQVEGWVFVVGQALALSLREDLTDIEDKICVLSKEFGEAQFFANHRVVELNIWARAINGELKRSFYYLGESGEVYRNVGEPTSIEKDLVYLSTPMENWEDFPNESDVLKVASSWSIDPQTFEEEKFQSELKDGYMGVA